MPNYMGDLKDKLLDVAGSFLPGIPKSSRQEEMERKVGEQRERVSERKRARGAALVVGSPSAKDYSNWMNLEKKKRKRDEDN